ncbi:MAG: carboxypeptidase regulatory-like domain-containing protein [Pirellulales bacterium]|nr:carboxypeptidase regulatory-like domain-containing protein [Pirellulales bacterium]
MKNVLNGFLAVLLFQGLALAQTGSVSGTVTDIDDNLLENARVVIGAPCQGLETWTGADGTFLFVEVEPGDYPARAMLTGFGMDADVITVIEDEVTVVDFILEMGGPHGPPHGGNWPHDWEEITLQGWTLVVPSENNPEVNHYFIDEDNDGVAEYRLRFGPWWYEPESGAQRPENGDEIDILGGLIGFFPGSPDLEVVVVWELNGEIWFDPDNFGHHQDYPEVVDVAGWAVVLEDECPFEQYWLDEDGDGETEFRLAFGPPDYDPGNGATRPLDDDWVEITGGLMLNPHFGPTVVVYEINGLFWRAPGDTTGLSFPLETVGETPLMGTPDNYNLVSAYPNPFNPSTTLEFTVHQPSAVEIAVYNVLGDRVMIIENDYLQAGTYTRTFNGNGLASGLYLINLQTGTETSTLRVLLSK